MKSEKLKRLIKKLRSKYRFVIYNDSTYEKVFVVKLSRVNVMSYMTVFSAILIAGSISAIAFTPLREYIPGYPDALMRQHISNNALLLDSLKDELRVKEQYVGNLKAIIMGEDNFIEPQTMDTSIDYGKIQFKKSAEDSVLRTEIEHEERFNLVLASPGPVKSGIEKLHFYPPLKGLITNRFNPSINHFGIDLVSKPNDPVMAVLKGTVILSTWTIETGYVLQIQHSNNIISVYKHNSKLLKSQGDMVDAGEAVAIMGNTGDLSSGPHLHFELWWQGKPVNPEEFIVF